MTIQITPIEVPLLMVLAIILILFFMAVGIWIVSNLGNIIRNFIRAINEDRRVK